MRKQARVGGLVGVGLSPAPTRLCRGYAPRVARLLLLGGGARGLRLAQEVGREGHAARVVTRSQDGRARIEAAGAECWIGDPDRLGTLRGALEGVAIACWLLGTARGSEEQLSALHGSRLRSFVAQTIDTTVRGLLYESAGTVPTGLLTAGAEIARATSAHNSIPISVIDADPAEEDRWLREALTAVRDLLRGSPTGSSAAVASDR